MKVHRCPCGFQGRHAARGPYVATNRNAVNLEVYATVAIRFFFAFLGAVSVSLELLGEVAL